MQELTRRGGVELRKPLLITPRRDGVSGLQVRQAVQIRLFNKHRAVERTIIDQQEWRYDAERERWLLHTGLLDVTQRY